MRRPVTIKDDDGKKWPVRVQLDDLTKWAIRVDGWVWYDEAWHCPDCRRRYRPRWQNEFAA